MRNSSDDMRLLSACRAGDHRAWKALLDRYERLVFSIPLQFGLSRDDAAEVAQATFSALVASLDRILDEERLGSWLATVARRQTWKVAQLRRRHNAELGAESPEPVDEETFTRRVEDMEWVHQGLVRLSDRCQRLLNALYFTDGEPSYDDVARELGVPVGSLGPTRARCLEAMRRILIELER